MCKCAPPHAMHAGCPTSSSWALYRKSPPLGRIRTCRGIRSAARTALIKPAACRGAGQYKAVVVKGQGSCHPGCLTAAGCQAAL